MYGNPKVHKEGVPLRPILAAFSAPSCKLARFLIGLMDSLVRNEYTVNNTYDFKEELKSLEYPEEIFMASFDITSLFTNVPVRETIDIVLNSLYEGQETVHNICKSQFKKLLELCVSDNHFIFNGEHFIQHEGFAMGSPLSASMANIFLCYHERKWLQDCPQDFKPLFYRRYVDDTFMIFKKKEHVDQFFNYINEKHRNIKFTKENENEDKLDFLDVRINKREVSGSYSFILGIFRKATFTGQGLNYHSYTYRNFKINSIKTLLVRALRLCSTWKDFHNEVQFLLNFFKTNAYPEWVVYNTIRKFLTNTFSGKPQVSIAPKLKLYVKFPYISNTCSRYIKSELSKFLSCKYPHIDFNFLFVNNFTIHRLLSHKEKLPGDLCSGLVYLYKCDVCGATYIGQSKRGLRTRASEHFGISSRTGSHLSRPSQSAVRDHIEICGSRRAVSNFKSLKSSQCALSLRIFESLEIHFRKPILNLDGSSYPLTLI